MRSLEQILCPDGCRCGNALPGLQGVRGRKAQAQKSKVCIVNGEGVGESMFGVVATEVIKEGEIITCFGSSATVQDGSVGQELASLMHHLSKQPGA